MGFLKRLGWYLFGLSIGLIFLMFFLKKKSEETGVDFCYLPNCRVLKDMQSKKLVLSDKAAEQLAQLDLDTLAVKSFLTDGSVDFSQSDTKAKPCKYYIVSKEIDAKEMQMAFSNCEDLVTLVEIIKD